MTRHSIDTTTGERIFNPAQHDATTFAPRHPLYLGLLFALCGGRPPGAYAALAPGLRLLARAARQAAGQLAAGRQRLLEQPRGDECARSRTAPR